MLMFFLFICKTFLYSNKSIMNNDSYHFFEDSLYASTLFLKFFSVKVGTLIICQFHTLKKGAKRGKVNCSMSQ